MYAMGRAIRTIREINEVRQEDLAEAVGVHPSLLCHIEKGRRRCKEELLERIALSLKVPVEDFRRFERRFTNDAKARFAN